MIEKWLDYITYYYQVSIEHCYNIIAWLFEGNVLLVMLIWWLASYLMILLYEGIKND
jgi:hypothetical protein